MHDALTISRRSHDGGGAPPETSLGEDDAVFDTVCQEPNIRLTAFDHGNIANRTATDRVAQVTAGAAGANEPGSIEQELIAVEPATTTVEEADGLAVENIIDVASTTFLEAKEPGRDVFENRLTGRIAGRQQRDATVE